MFLTKDVVNLIEENNLHDWDVYFYPRKSFESFASYTTSQQLEISSLVCNRNKKRKLQEDFWEQMRQFMTTYYLDVLSLDNGCIDPYRRLYKAL